MQFTNPPLQSEGPEYRVFMLDEHGRIRKAHELTAPDDEGALTSALGLEQSYGFELWQLARRIAVVDRDGGIQRRG